MQLIGNCLLSGSNDAILEVVEMCFDRLSALCALSELTACQICTVPCRRDVPVMCAHS